MNYREELKKLIQQTPEQLWEKYTERITYKDKVVVEVEKVNEDPLLVYTQFINYLQIPVRKAYVVKKICQLLKQELDKECSSTLSDTTELVGGNVDLDTTVEESKEAETKGSDFDIDKFPVGKGGTMSSYLGFDEILSADKQQKLKANLVSEAGDLVNPLEQLTSPNNNCENLSNDIEKVREIYLKEQAALLGVDVETLRHTEQRRPLSEVIKEQTPFIMPTNEEIREFVGDVIADFIEGIDNDDEVDANYEKLTYEQVRERYGDDVAGLFKVGENVEIFVLNNKEENSFDPSIRYSKQAVEQIRAEYGDEVADSLNKSKQPEIVQHTKGFIEQLQSVTNPMEDAVDCGEIIFQTIFESVAEPNEGRGLESVTPQDECTELNDDFVKSDKQCDCCVSECKNCDMSNFGDGLEWQKEVREDRVLEFGINYVDKEGNEELVIDIPGNGEDAQPFISSSLDSSIESITT